MKILYITPSNRFVKLIKPRIDYISKYVEVDPISITPKETLMLKFLRKLLKKRPLPQNMQMIEEQNYKWKYLYYKQNLLTKLLIKIFPKTLINKIVKTIEKNIKIEEYDFIHCHLGYPYGYVSYLLKQKYNIPYVLTLHGSEIHTEPFKKNWLKKLTLLALNNADRTIFVSNALKESAKLLGFNNSKNATVVQNGIDTNLFKVLDKNKIKNELGLTKKVIGFAGHLIPVKRFEKFPEIFKSIIECNNDNVEFLIMGDGYLRNTVEQELISSNIKCVFLGYVEQSNLSYYINAVDVIILPSRNEGFPSIVKEAHACGVPVVGSSNGGIPEAIGDERFVVKEGENFEHRFALKVCEILNENFDSIKLREIALEYSCDKTTAKEISVYNDFMQSI